VANAENAKSAAATTRAELFEKTVPDIVLTPLVRRRSVLSFQPWLPARDGEPRERLRVSTM
jgi:hypothetical protein